VSFACFVSWNNYIIQFGGSTSVYSKKVQKYDPSTGKWTTITTTPPFDLYHSGCQTLPNGNVLIAGSMANSVFYKAYTEYNVSSNVWSPVIFGNVTQYDSTPLVLGSRLYVIPPGCPKPVEEYIYANSSLTVSSVNFNITISSKPAAVAVPAQWFSNLPGGCKGIN
jgi:hypothetical protein